MLMERSRSQLLLIDIQERLAPQIADGDLVAGNCVRLARYAERLAIPSTVTEHYPNGLGPSTPALIAALSTETPQLAKVTFSAWKDAAIRSRIGTLVREGRDQVVVAGTEAHVCVGQTCLDLISAGLKVFLVADAVGSRAPHVRDLAIQRMDRAGVHIVSHEMGAFEWIGRGDTKEFKDLIEVLK